MRGANLININIVSCISEEKKKIKVKINQIRVFLLSIHIYATSCTRFKSSHM